MNKQKIIDYIELLEAKAYQSDDYFIQRNELYILNNKYKEVLDKIKEEVLTELQNCKPKDMAISMEINYIEEKLERLLEEMKWIKKILLVGLIAH